MKQLIQVTFLFQFVILFNTRVFAQPSETFYFSLANGDLTTNVWSLISHVGTNCGCNPTCSIPANTTIRISHIITANCNVVIGSNATIIVESGGAFIVTGNGNISGTGNLQVDAGGSMDVSGNLTLSGGGDATINGSLNVGGNLTISTGASVMCGNGDVAVSGSVSGTPCATLTLPIELISFNAAPDNGEVELTWTTASEINNDYFTIERSTDGISWEGIKQVDGSENSNVILNYSAVDENPYPGVSYYRLKQTDFNGATSHSNSVAVSLASIQIISAYPNPSDGEISFIISSEFEDALAVRITDTKGALVKQIDFEVTRGSNTLSMDMSQYISGNYIISLYLHKNQVSQKHFVIK